MGQLVEFPSNGHTCRGYLAAPAAGRGPAVVVIQEWWGLVPHIEDLVERFAKEGFLAIAPDLYHGKKTTSPDEAGRMLMELDGDRAESEIAGAGSYLLARPECASKKYGVVGFCMGGALAQYTAATESSVGAGVSFYGGFKQIPIPWPNLAAPLLLIYGENDGSVTPDSGRKLAGELTALGKKVELAIYPNAGHAFFNDSRPQVYNKTASEDAWKKTLNLFRANL